MTDHLRKFEIFVLERCEDRPLPAGLDTKLSELGLDSLDLLDLILAIENEFGIEIDMDGIDDDVTLREIGTRFLQ